MDVLKKKRVRTDSLSRSKYCTFQCITEPILEDWVLWDKLKIDQISYCTEDTYIRVVVRSCASLRIKTWTTFMALLNGFNMEKKPAHKHICPERKYVVGNDIKIIKVCLYSTFIFYYFFYTSII